MKYYAQTICGGIIRILKLGYRKVRSHRRFPIDENKQPFHEIEIMRYLWLKRIVSSEVFCHRTKLWRVNYGRRNDL